MDNENENIENLEENEAEASKETDEEIIAEEEVAEEVTEDEDTTVDEKQPREVPHLTDDELDNVADTAIDFIQSIVSYFNLGEITINEYEGADRELILDINGDDLAILIGKHGSTLDSIQQIVSMLSYKKLGFYYPVIIDVEGYKSRQRIKLENLAKNLANKVARTNQTYSMHPMNPYKRRIVHTYLSNDSRVETHSEGEGRDRHLVITPA